jgi:hypothetical protein
MDKTVPKGTILLIPTVLHCPDCNHELGSSYELLWGPLRCDKCNKDWPEETFSKYFGMIKGIGE